MTDGNEGASPHVGGQDTAPLASGFDHLCEVRADVAAPPIVGHGPTGERRMVPVLGGAVAGSRLSGNILPGGAD